MYMYSYSQCTASTGCDQLHVLVMYSVNICKYIVTTFINGIIQLLGRILTPKFHGSKTSPSHRTELRMFFRCKGMPKQNRTWSLLELHK